MATLAGVVKALGSDQSDELRLARRLPAAPGDLRRIARKGPRRARNVVHHFKRRGLASARKTRRTLRRHLRRRYRVLRMHFRRRYLVPLQRDIRVLGHPYRGGRWRAIHGTPLAADVRALRTWRGGSPRVALRNYYNHPIWGTYRTHPPLRYAPSPLAELDHWVDTVPEEAENGVIPADHRSSRRARRPHILEMQHWYLLAGTRVWQWERARGALQRANERMRADECKAVITYSRGSAEHFRQFLDPDVWHKLDYVFPAFPAQPEAALSRDRGFTVLAIGDRFSDKGIPEALRAFELLRERHGTGVRMVLVSSTVPRSYRVPDGVVVHDTPRMSPELRAAIYRSADVLVELPYLDSLTCLIEASAFGVPAVATRIHHGEDFVRDGENGYLIDPPLFAYTEDYGRRWGCLTGFRRELDVMREGGRLAGVAEDVADRLDLMLSAGSDLDELRVGARRMHAKRFSPEVRNLKLNAVYARALGS